MDFFYLNCSWSIIDRKVDSFHRQEFVLGLQEENIKSNRGSGAKKKKDKKGGFNSMKAAQKIS